MALKIGFIVDALGGVLHGDPHQDIDGLAALHEAGQRELAFLSQARYLEQLKSSRAACVIVAPEFEMQARQRGDCIVTEQPYLYYARLTQLWKRHLTVPQPGRIHASAVIDPLAQIDPTAVVGALCVVEAGAVIGAQTELKARVTVGANCRIGARCILHSGVVIGADGFGFAPDGDRWEKIEQLGAVRIADDVEIGANTCIDRGALHDTVIEDGVKLDNLIQIGHNVHVGAHTAMAGCVGVAGSARIGAHCTVGGGAVILGHLELADRVHISAASVVTRSIRQPGHYSGVFPIDDNAAWEKNAVSLKQLSGLRDRVRALERAQGGQAAGLPAASEGKKK